MGPTSRSKGEHSQANWHFSSCSNGLLSSGLSAYAKGAILRTAGDVRIEVAGRQLRITGMRLPPPRRQSDNVLFSSSLLGEALSALYGAQGNGDTQAAVAECPACLLSHSGGR